MSFARTWLSYDRALESRTDDADANGEDGLHGGEIGREEKTSVVVEARRLLVKVGRLENRGDERQVEIDLPSGGRGKSGGAHERNEIHVGVAFQQLNCGAVSRCSLSALGDTDGYVENVARRTAHWDELEFQLEEASVGETLSDALNDAGGRRDDGTVNAASPGRREGATLSPVEGVVISDYGPLSGELSGVVTLPDRADAAGNGSEGSSVGDQLGHSGGGCTDGACRSGNLILCERHFE